MIPTVTLLILSVFMVQESDGNAVVAGKTFEIKDKHGLPVAQISDVRLFRYSDYFKKVIPDFKMKVRNTAGENLEGEVCFTAKIGKQDGSTVTFDLYTYRTMQVGLESRTGLRTDAEFIAEKQFTNPFPYGPENFKTLTVELSMYWQSPEDLRIAAREKQRKAKQTADELVRLKAEQAKQEAAERAKLRVACAVVYRNTANKKVSDLTVREAQQVQACQALGLYQPH